MREYKVGAGAWQLYTEPVEVTDNGTVHARSTDAAGNESEESSYALRLRLTDLTSHVNVTRRFILQKARHHP
ncbi:OmpL47-type beta-barrel domain-containing protein [Cohnella fermenti]|uniref:Uncharacterized protein n=1 Tax=Cohnella fermenti TaxID=2565925 RepID=A0A4S4BEB9_9BACL|nr:chitobiase/beta-hexosaminidase C-terminal domain-containing protein [Cohnella fermenti]THF72130.1 hypothetical protein E6C55_33550 [Cohnella fermenti]